MTVARIVLRCDGPIGRPWPTTKHAPASMCDAVFDTDHGTADGARAAAARDGWTIHKRGHHQRWVDLCPAHSEGGRGAWVDAGLS